MAKHAGVPEKKILAALRKFGGIQALAAREVGITRQSLHQRVQRSAKLTASLTEIEDENLDLGEGHLLKYLRDGDKDMVKYYLDRKGKRRGYGNNVQVGLDERQIEGIVAALGGDPAKLRAALIQLGVDPDQDP